MGHRRLDGSAEPPFGCAPTLMLEPISWLRSARLPLAGGDIDDEATETVLSDGAKGLEDRAGGVGPKPFPLPRILPPPSLRDMAMGCSEAKKKKIRTEKKHKDHSKTTRTGRSVPRAASLKEPGRAEHRAERKARLRQAARGGCAEWLRRSAASRHSLALAHATGVQVVDVEAPVPIRALKKGMRRR